MAGIDPSGYACEKIAGGAECNFEANIFGSRIKSQITATLKGNDLSWSGSAVVGNDTLVSGSGTLNLGLAVTSSGAKAGASPDGDRRQNNAPISAKGSPSLNAPNQGSGSHQAWAPPLEWALPSPYDLQNAGLRQGLIAAGQTYAGFDAWFRESGVGSNPFTGESIGGVDAWDERFVFGAGMASGVMGLMAKDVPIIVAPYVRPTGAVTRAQRAYVQGKPCVDCGVITPRQVADHRIPLVSEYYGTGKIDMQRARSLDAVQPQCPTHSCRQGGQLSQYSRRQREQRGLDDE